VTKVFLATVAAGVLLQSTPFVVRSKHTVDVKAHVSSLGIFVLPEARNE
jgi:hypothetical protein